MTKLKRGDDVPRPKPWRVRLHSLEAARGWAHLSSQSLEALDRAWVDITAEPRSTANPCRQHPLKGKLSVVKFGGRELDQWQYEVTAGGRVWYLIDDSDRTLWITLAEPGHPGVTDKRGGRRKR